MWSDISWKFNHKNCTYLATGRTRTPIMREWRGAKVSLIFVVVVAVWHLPPPPNLTTNPKGKRRLSLSHLRPKSTWNFTPALPFQIERFYQIYSQLRSLPLNWSSGRDRFKQPCQFCHCRQNNVAYRIAHFPTNTVVFSTGRRSETTDWLIYSKPHICRVCILMNGLTDLHTDHNSRARITHLSEIKWNAFRASSNSWILATAVRCIHRGLQRHEPKKRLVGSWSKKGEIIMRCVSVLNVTVLPFLKNGVKIYDRLFTTSGLLQAGRTLWSGIRYREAFNLAGWLWCGSIMMAK